MNLEGKTAVVTGASSGIGAEFSKALIAKSCSVYGLARRSERLNTLQSKLGELFIPVALDITNDQDVTAWANKTFGPSGTKHPSMSTDQGDSSANASLKPSPDILINNAGVGYFGSVDELPPEQWEVMMQTNLTSVFRLTRLFVPFMKNKEETSHIVNISSVAGLIGNPNLSGYNATKFGLKGFSEALMKELREFKIKVTCMFPGSIATEFFNDHGGTHPNMMRPEDVAHTLTYILETRDNFLIDEITMRPLVPKRPK